MFGSCGNIYQSFTFKKHQLYDILQFKYNTNTFPQGIELLQYQGNINYRVINNG